MKFPEIDALTLDGRVKGIPGDVAAFPLGEIGAKGWNVLREDLPLPVAVLRQSALTRNARWMREFLGVSGAVIAPHGKTTMSPQLFQQQLADGAWAMTVATVQQLRICRDFGIGRVVLANQLIGKQSIHYVLGELKRDPKFDFYCVVDSVANVEQLAAAARDAKPGRPLQVLLEGGMDGGRTGCRTLEDGARRGARGEGGGAASRAARRRGVRGAGPYRLARGRCTTVTRFLDFLVEIAIACEKAQLFAPEQLILSAGGSAFYDIVVERFRRPASRATSCW